MSINALRGMNDLLPSDIPLWQEIEEKARSLFGRYHYQEIRTPILEEMALFTRTVGETTNIVEKEMYTFQDRNGKWVALRPEATASVVRAAIEHHFFQEDPVARLYYMGPMYRYERPQKGRFRQFYQLGAEAFGIASPRLDAEVIHMLDQFFRELVSLSTTSPQDTEMSEEQKSDRKLVGGPAALGLANIELEINSLGCPLCRPQFIRAFLDFLFKHEGELCIDCRRRMEKNPLRVLDCNQEQCQKVTADAPSIQDYLCETCEKDFDTVLSTLGLLGTPYRINSRIVRGLDYYIKTTFEFTSTSMGSQNAIAGGGRYDGLVRLLGGPNIPAFGFAIGMERLVDILRECRKKDAKDKGQRRGLFIAALGEKALNEALGMADQLRLQGFAVDLDYEGKSLKSQMRRADKIGARYVVVLGENELEKKSATLKDMTSGTQELLPWTELPARLAT